MNRENLQENMATQKQQKAIDNLFETRGNVGKAMLLAGYDKTTAKNPSNLTNSKAFITALDKKLPNSHLLKKHREFLDTPRYVRTFRKGDLTTEIEETDPAAIKALDMAYKLKGFYSETPDASRPVTINILQFNGNTTDNNPIQVQPKTISITVPISNGQRDKASGDSVAPEKR